MIYTKEERLRDFEFWGQAVYVVEELDESELDEVETHLADMFIDTPTETDINDFFIEEQNLIAQWLGFADWESLVNYHREADL